MYINTRARALTLTAICSIIFGLMQYGHLHFKFFNIITLNLLVDAIILGVIVFLGVCWVVEWKIRYIRLITVASFPAIFVAVYAFFVQLSLLQSFLSIKGWLLSFFLMAMFVFLLYFLILNANILNIASISAVPLERAAKTAQYIYSLFFCYLLTVVAYSLNLPIWVRFMAVIMMFFFLVYQTFWTLNISSKQLASLTIPLSIIFFLWAGVVTMWPMSPPFVAIVYTTFLYIIFGLGLDRVGKISFLSQFEYITVLILVLAFCLLVSNWGINGRLL